MSKPFYRVRTRSGFPIGARTFWSTLDGPLGVLSRRVWDFEVDGGPGPDGPLIVAANHFSHLDPFMISMALQRPIRFLGVDELYGRTRTFDAFTLWMGTIPLPRNRPPLGAMRISLNELRHGGVVALFPEGRRVAEWGDDPPKEGAAWLAMRTGVPILPVAVAGSDVVYGLGATEFRRHPLRVAIGQPLRPERFANRTEMMETWFGWMDDAIAGLRRGIAHFPAGE